jgi:L-ascorbate metabolism protein UlaG (beta-lactamase superfamily)
LRFASGALCVFATWATVDGTPGSSGSPQSDSATLEYVAHASFLIGSPGGVELLIDPYASAVWLGYEFPAGLDPDAILITHPHYDHDGGRFRGGELWWDEDMRIIDAPGSYEVGDISVLGIQGKHADPYGEEFGQRNTIMVIDVSGLRLAHVGDNGPLTPELVRAMGPIDILMLPIDGEEHILSNEAVETAIAAALPRILIPMHYRIPELETSPDSPSDLGEIEPWLEGRDNVVRLDTNRIALSPDTLPPEPTIMVFPHSPALQRRR